MIKKRTFLLKQLLKKSTLIKTFAFIRKGSNYPKEVDSNFINNKDYDVLTLEKNDKYIQKNSSDQEEVKFEEEEIYYKVNFDYLREVEARVLQYMNEYLDEFILDLDKLDLNTSFKDLEIDSLLQTELVIYVENCLGVRFGDSEALEIETLYDLVLLSHRYYSEKRNKQTLQLIKNKEIAARTRFNKKFNL